MDASSTHETTPLLPSVDTLPVRWDHRQSYEKQLAMYMILASTLFERTAFYSLAGNFAPSIQLSSDDTCSSTFKGTALFSGVSYLSTLIFAVLSDAKLGRGRTIMLGFVLYLIGYISACVLATDSPTSCTPSSGNNTTSFNTEILTNEQRTSWMNAALIIIAAGAGAVKSNLAVFGAEQKQPSTIKSRYFDQYFIAVNIGIMIATLFIPLIPNSKGINSRSAYLFATSMIFLATVTFFIGYRFYKHATPIDSVITMCIPVLWDACRTWYQNRRYIQRQVHYSRLAESVTEDSAELNQIPETFLDYAKVIHHGRCSERIVDDVKSLRSAFLVFILLIPYWLIYNQLYTTFPQQGEYMQRPNIEYFPFWMTLGDPITVSVGTIIFNMCLYKYLDGRNRSLTTVRKFIIGMFLASVTMFISGGVEVIRQLYCPGNEITDESPEERSSKLSLYIQLFQSVFMGLAELFATVACFEFAYFAAPRSAQSLFMSLYYCTVGLGSFLGTGYMNLFSSDGSTLDFRCPSASKMYSNFYNYFFVLAGIQLLFVIIFIVGQKKFRIIPINPQ